MSVIESERVPGSFRDPAGFMFERDGTLYRQVNPEYQAHYDTLIGSGLYAALAEQRLLVPHVETDAVAGSAGAYRILAPERVPFVTYPFEWCFGELLAAARLTLQV